VFPNAGSMAKSKGKVDKGTGPADLEQDTVCIWEHISKHKLKTYLLFMESNLSGLKMSGSAKCSCVPHIVAVGI